MQKRRGAPEIVIEVLINAFEPRRADVQKLFITRTRRDDCIHVCIADSVRACVTS